MGDSCTTALLAGREGRRYTITVLLTEIERDSCTTALLAETEKIAERLHSLEG